MHTYVVSLFLYGVHIHKYIYTVHAHTRAVYVCVGYHEPASELYDIRIQ